MKYFSVYASCDFISFERFEKLIEQKKPVHLVFFSTWCSDCLESLKSIKNTEQEKRTYVLISTFHSDPISAEKSLKKLGVKAMCILDKDLKIAKKFSIEKVPKKIFISK